MQESTEYAANTP